MTMPAGTSGRGMKEKARNDGRYSEGFDADRQPGSASSGHLPGPPLPSGAFARPLPVDSAALARRRRSLLARVRRQALSVHVVPELATEKAFAHYSRAAAPPPDDEPVDAAAPGGAAPRSAAAAAREAVRCAYLAPVLGGEEAPVPVACQADAGAFEACLREYYAAGEAGALEAPAPVTAEMRDARGSARATSAAPRVSPATSQLKLRARRDPLVG
ncbi:hypothetical protein WJX81_005854 [Elliptochloris bilobata]|uniref:Uncharacterized protein n=1 Tax=Elliptochloris bilobata TaxID=381761 RepID=A0AAW1RBB7_9CHLO